MPTVNNVSTNSPLVGVHSEGMTDSSNFPPTTQEESSYISDQTSASPILTTQGDIPDPDGESATEGGSLTSQLQELQDLLQQMEELAYLAERGDVQAQEYYRQAAQRVAQIQTNISQKYGISPEELQEFIDNPSPDFDGDTIINEEEIRLGTSPFSNDTDGDGLTDTVEVYGKGKFEASIDRLLDPLNADADGDGRIDGSQIPDFVKKSGAGGGADGVGGTDGSSSDPVYWPATPSDAANVDTTSGSQTSTSQWTAVTAHGDVTFSLSGNDLIIKDANGTITIEDYLGADGEPQKTVELKGDIENINTYNLNPDVLKPTVGQDGVATAGLKVSTASGNTPPFNPIVDPFNGALPLGTPVNGENVIEIPAGFTGTFQFPPGTHIVNAKNEGDDVVIEIEYKNGEKSVFRLKNGRETVKEFHIKFVGTDGDELINFTDMTARIDAGGGNDVVKAGDLSDVDLGDGNDIGMYSVSNTVTGPGHGAVVFRGGAGNDILMGSDERDYLFGNDGKDIIYSGKGEDVARGGEGSDALIAADPNAPVDFDGGGGIDVTSSLYDGIQGFEMGPSSNSVVDFMNEQLANETDEDIRKTLQEGIDQAEQANVISADEFKNLVLNYLNQKISSDEASFTGDDSGQSFGPPPPEDEEEEDTGP